MVEIEFKFKERGGSGFTKIVIGENGSMEMEASEFKNPSETCVAIGSLARAMLRENWVQVQVREV